MPLLRRTAQNGVVFYSSVLLEMHEIPHAFSTRIGGVSPPPFESMNLGNPNGCAVQDQSDYINENYRRLMQAIGRENLPRFYVHQIHGDIVHTVDGPDFSCSNKGDALVTRRAGVVLSVRVADCCPVLLSTRDGQAVAAVHAGWRGAVGHVIAAAVSRLTEISDMRASDLLAAVGPCIGFDALEVGPEVLAQFENRFGSDAPIRHDGDDKGHVDLGTACRLQLLRSGLLADRIDVTDRSTHRDVAEFFSHRRDNGVTGRMAALIASR